MISRQSLQLMRFPGRAGEPESFTALPVPHHRIHKPTPDAIVAVIYVLSALTYALALTRRLGLAYGFTAFVRNPKASGRRQHLCRLVVLIDRNTLP